jgi:hypothetical protein
MEKDNKGRFTKGNKGKPKGATNKTTNKIREAFTKLVEENLENMTLWLADVAGDDPKAALDIINKMAEYTTPKLARVENSHEMNEKDTSINISIVRGKE